MTASLRESEGGGLTCLSFSIIILCDVRFVREALVEIFGRSSEVNLLGATDESGAAFDRILVVQPDIALIDTAFPDALASVRHIKKEVPNVRIIALGLTETPENVIVWVEAGISGYIPRSTSLNDVIPMLHKAMRDEQACSTQVTSGLMRRIAETAHKATAVSIDPRLHLTKRELEILHLIRVGLSNKEIARRLDIGLATTKSHVHNVLGKLRVDRRGQAAVRMRNLMPFAAASSELMD
jgi:DNA-binding NarL/FixJ family response regulator